MFVGTDINHEFIEVIIPAPWRLENRLDAEVCRTRIDIGDGHGCVYTFVTLSFLGMLNVLWPQRGNEDFKIEDGRTSTTRPAEDERPYRLRAQSCRQQHPAS